MRRKFIRFLTVIDIIEVIVCVIVKTTTVRRKSIRFLTVITIIEVIIMRNSNRVANWGPGTIRY